VVFSIFALLKHPEPDWGNDEDWKLVRIMPGRENGKGQGNKGKVNPMVSAGYSAIKTCWVNMLKHAGNGNSELNLSKIASLARRSSAQMGLERLSATAGLNGQVACLSLLFPFINYMAPFPRMAPDPHIHRCELQVQPPKWLGRGGGRVTAQK